jgi:CRISPR-associated exonuclease Cas4
MFGSRVGEGALFYGLPRRRHVVAFDAALRNLTLEVIHGARELFTTGRTPPATFDPKRCNACSLLDLCEPRLFAHAGSVEDWLMRQLQD